MPSERSHWIETAVIHSEFHCVIWCQTTDLDRVVVVVVVVVKTKFSAEGFLETR
jgi:hypothetical protein